MTTKRKLDDSPSADQPRPSHDEGTASTSPQGALAPAENYPRKRIAIACNVCRFRKTRCDAQKPSCGFCTDLGIECTYRKPTVGDRVKPSGPAPEALANIERRLSQLEARLDSTQQLVQNSAMLSPNVSNHSEMPPPHDSGSRRSSVNRSVADYINNVNLQVPSIGTPVSYDFAYRETSTEALTARPSLISFRAPPYVNVDSWDYTGEFYTDEILEGDRLCDLVDQLLQTPLDMTKGRTRRFLNSFVENFLRWTPLFSAGHCVNALEQSGDFSKSTPTVCLSFMILALGAISENNSENPVNTPPGLEYFARGCQILERLSLRTGNLTTIQCRVLQSAYFKFAIRPMQSWNSITQAARDCMHILTSKIMDRMTHAEKEAFNRVFWACSIILHELEATMKMHPIGLRHFHELVPLPQFEEEDSGFYFFLAQISLRKFLTQSLEVVGYLSGRVIYAPVVTGELRKQVREWYDHLPSVVRFPLDSSPVFDSRKSFLRGQYVALFVVLGWPAVLKIMEHGQSDAPPLEPDKIIVSREQADSCIKSCALYLSVADEQLMGRKMGTNFSLYAAFATLATLLITFNCPALAFVDETKQEQHIRNGYEILRPWEHLPLVRRGLERARILMQQAGLAHIYLAHADEPPPVVVPIVSPGMASTIEWQSPRSGTSIRA